MKDFKFFIRMIVIFAAIPFIAAVSCFAIPFVTIYFIVQLFVSPKEVKKKVKDRVLHPSFETLNEN